MKRGRKNVLYYNIYYDLNDILSDSLILLGSRLGHYTRIARNLLNAFGNWQSQLLGTFHAKPGASY